MGDTKNIFLKNQLYQNPSREILDNVLNFLEPQKFNSVTWLILNSKKVEFFASKTRFYNHVKFYSYRTFVQGGIFTWFFFTLAPETFLTAPSNVVPKLRFETVSFLVLFCIYYLHFVFVWCWFEKARHCKTCRCENWPAVEPFELLFVE